MLDEGAATAPVDQYDGQCPVCGHVATFVRNARSAREGFQCPSCRGSLRYQHQAHTIVDIYSRTGTVLREAAKGPAFRELAIYEPGLIGPFRKILADLPKYVASYYWPDVAPGDTRDGVRCEDLQQLTFDDQTFDMVITSDIFEHVRDPWAGFAETFRVLKPGGRHICSIPVTFPVPDESHARVDTSGPEDVFIDEPVYHGSPTDPDGSLVYTDFGQDLPDILATLGFQVAIHYGRLNTMTYVMRRPV